MSESNTIENAKWTAHVEQTRDDLEFELKRVSRAVRAGDDAKRQEFLRTLNVVDVTWEAGFLIAAIMAPNATIATVRAVLDKQIISPVINLKATLSWSAK